MYDRYRLTAKQAEIAATFGIRPPYEPDETYPDIFPMGTKTPFYGQVVVQNGADRKIERMEWGCAHPGAEQARRKRQADQVRDQRTQPQLELLAVDADDAGAVAWCR